MKDASKNDNTFLKEKELIFFYHQYGAIKT